MGIAGEFNRTQMYSHWFRNGHRFHNFVLAAMMQIHEGGYRHKDLFARNIVLTSDGVAKIADFSEAHFPTTKPIGVKNDVSCFGALLWEIFTVNHD